MIGPVFALEWMRTGRRSRAHILRWIVGAWLLLQFLLAYHDYLDRDNGTGQPGVLASFAVSFLDFVLMQQFLIVVLVTPALVAGTITDEKSRGTLEYLLTTQLAPLAIVAGKLLARMADVIVLTLVVLPLAAFVGPYAGASPTFLLGQAAVTLLTAFGLSCISLLASVWTRQTRMAVLAVYAVVLAAVGAYWNYWPAAPEWARAFDPIWVLTPAREGAGLAEIGRRLGLSALVWSGFGAVCIGIAAWRLRPAHVKQLAARRTWFGRLRGLARPAPSWNPVVWKERFVGRRIPLWAGVAAVAALTMWLVLRALRVPAPAAGMPSIQPVEVIMSQVWWAIGLLTLLVGVQTSGVISGERERQTWDGLLMTPMTIRELVRGKFHGVLAAAWPYLLTYILATAAAVAIHAYESPIVPLSFGALTLGVAAISALLAPRTALAGFVVLSLAWGLFAGVAVFIALSIALLVGWLTMQFLAAVGLWCSVRCTSSWRSLVLTTGLGSIGGAVVTCVSLPLACITSIVFSLATAAAEFFLEVAADDSFSGYDFPETLLPLFAAIGVALTFWWVARSLVFAAEEYLAATERIPTGRVRQSYEGRRRLEMGGVLVSSRPFEEA